MLSLAEFSIQRPKFALAGWLIAALALTLVGFGAASTVSPTITVVPGTQSSRAQQLANAQFGPTQLVPILLEGPQGEAQPRGPEARGRARQAPSHARALGVGCGQRQRRPAARGRPPR